MTHSVAFADPCYDRIGSPLGGSEEETATGGVSVEETVGVPVAERPFDPIGDRDSPTTTLEDALKTGNTDRLASTLKHALKLTASGWETLAQQDAAPPRDFPDLGLVVPQPWLYRYSTLQQTGRYIGAELEVAMLCMQKRLGKVSYINTR